MNLQIQIGTASTPQAGLVAVYLRELDCDCGPTIQIGDDPGDGDIYTSLADFMSEWSRHFNPALTASGTEDEIEEAFRSTARNDSRLEEGSLEIDDNAVVSVSDDCGAYVQAWLWVRDEDAGIQRCLKCERMEVTTGSDWQTDDDDGAICPNCANNSSVAADPA